MHLNHVLTMLAAQDPAGQQQGPPGWTQLVLFVPIIIMFYFLLIRPQQKKAKEHAELIKTVKPGDKVVTSGGIVGIVVSVREKAITVRSADTKLEVTKSAVAEITERSGQSSES